MWFPPALIDLPNIAPVTLPEADRPSWLFWILMGPCASGWLVAYGLAIYRAKLDKRVGIPVFVVEVNLAWEFTLSLILDQADVQRPINLSWFLVDCFILRQTLAYGWKDYPGMSRRTFRWMVFGVIAWSAVFHIMTTYELKDATGIYTGTGLNVFLSLSFIFMLNRRGSSLGQSMYVALAKGIGSFFAGWTVLVMYPGHHLFIFLFLTVWTIDATYCVLLYRKVREEGRSPWAWNRGPTEVPDAPGGLATGSAPRHGEREHEEAAVRSAASG
ncbi:hypothetical protein GTZ78_16660 [Streptomyces sp. SID8361]|nr:hypothetical protein [Streptomyces sp. SID8361]SCF90006.1 hypothetical protein GA0115260_103874 [Streptomyces sp. MnatMP-M27]